MSHKMLRLSIVVDRTGLSRSTIYRRMAEGGFPLAVPLGGRSVGWLDADIEAWIEAQLILRQSNRSALHGSAT